MRVFFRSWKTPAAKNHNPFPLRFGVLPAQQTRSIYLTVTLLARSSARLLAQERSMVRNLPLFVFILICFAYSPYIGPILIFHRCSPASMPTNDRYHSHGFCTHKEAAREEEEDDTPNRNVHTYTAPERHEVMTPDGKRKKKRTATTPLPYPPPSMFQPTSMETKRRKT